jgi:hypothetical protein
MRCNVGPRERVIRLAAGMATAAIALSRPMSPWKRVGLGSVAAAEIITAITRYCPVNQLVGMDNCPEHDPAAAI